MSIPITNVETLSKGEKWSFVQTCKHWIFGGKKVDLLDGSEAYVYKYQDIVQRLKANTVGWRFRLFGPNLYVTQAWKNFEQIKDVSIQKEDSKGRYRWTFLQKCKQWMRQGKTISFYSTSGFIYNGISAISGPRAIHIYRYAGVKESLLANIARKDITAVFESKVWRAQKELDRETFEKKFTDIFQDGKAFAQYLGMSDTMFSAIFSEHLGLKIDPISTNNSFARGFDLTRIAAIFLICWLQRDLDPARFHDEDS